MSSDNSKKNNVDDEASAPPTAALSDQVAWNSFLHGMWYGGATLVPSTALVYYCAMNIPKFASRTNFQSRTALAIMPALFVFGATGEHHLSMTVRRMMDERQHKEETVQWADRVQQQRRATQRAQQQQQQQQPPQQHHHHHSIEETQQELNELYRDSIHKSGNFRIVPGNHLSWYHHVGNFWQEHPAKILIGAAIPTLFYIFYSRSQQKHLQLQMAVMHTRVMGQFTVVLFMLTLMGGKGYMDQHGKFITEAEAEDRVEELHRVRQDLMDRLRRERDLRHAQEEQAQRARLAAREQAKQLNLAETSQ